MVSAGGKRRRLVGTSSALLLLVIAGCHGGSNGRNGNLSESSPSLGRLCGDASVLTRTGEAFEVITGGKREVITDDGATIAGAARGINTERDHVMSGFGDVCRISVPSATRVQRLHVFWQLLPNDSDEPAPEFTRLDMGEGAGAAWDMAYVTFICVPPGASYLPPGYVSVFVESEGVFTEPRDDVEDLKNAHVTVAHAFSLAVAKEVGCAEKAGIPAEPVLIP